MYVCVPCADKAHGGQGFLRTGVMDGGEPPRECWDTNLGPQEEKPVFFTAEPSLQPLRAFFIIMENSVKKVDGGEEQGGRP